MKLYSLKCKSLKIYNTPFVCSDDGHAVSIVREAVRQGNDSGLVSNIEDLSLFCLGEFDSKEGLQRVRPKQVIDLVSIPGILNLVKEAVEKVNVES